MDVIESDGDDRDQEDGEDEQCRNPERRQTEGHSEGAEVLADGNKVAVNQQGHSEEESDTSEDNDVVEYCPVRSVEGNLETKLMFYFLFVFQKA